MKTGIELIAIERAEQINKHGYTPESDKHDYEQHELILLVEYLLKDDNDAERDNIREYLIATCFPEWLLNKFDSKSKIQRLTVAGALIAAEIDRLQ